MHLNINIDGSRTCALSNDMRVGTGFESFSIFRHVFHTKDIIIFLCLFQNFTFVLIIHW